MNMVDKVVNEKYYAKSDTEKVDLGRLYYLYTIAFLLLLLFSFIFLFTWSKLSVELLN